MVASLGEKITIITEHAWGGRERGGKKVRVSVFYFSITCLRMSFVTLTSGINPRLILLSFPGLFLELFLYLHLDLFLEFLTIFISSFSVYRLKESILVVKE